MADKSTNLETDIALIKSDIKQIHKFFGRVESSMEILADVQKQTALNTQTLKYHGDQIEDLEKATDSFRREEGLRMTVLSDRLEEYRRMAREDHSKLTEKNNRVRSESQEQVLDRIDKMERGLHERITFQTKRINSLENWKYYMMGIGAVMVFIVVRVNWPSFFS
tara:strand:- start:22 stop:516 length:495 start_codon:yes stop_codon:yes gene_type:complete